MCRTACNRRRYRPHLTNAAMRSKRSGTQPNVAQAGFLPKKKMGRSVPEGRSHREPSLVSGPTWIFPPVLGMLGTSPAYEQREFAPGERVTSPISVRMPSAEKSLNRGICGSMPAVRSG